MEPYLHAFAFLLAAGALLIAGRTAARWIDRSSARATEQHAKLMAEMNAFNLADWIPTSERLPGEYTVPFHRKDVDLACGLHGVCFGQYFTGRELDVDQGELPAGETGAWSCDLGQEWVPGSMVDFWFDLPPAPPAPGEERERGKEVGG